MNKYDLNILTQLQQRGRLSNRELAQRVGLSPPPCWRRVNALEQTGIIADYVARLDPEKLGLTIVAFAHVSLENHHPDTINQFADVVASLTAILECHMTSGDHDYMLKIVATDMQSYHQFVTDNLLSLPGVRTMNTSFSMGHTKNTTSLPLTHLQ